ncbi:Homocysteine S-methyltransferase [Oopsacas minuta]|uniref:Homocysteine S-methyltransferase n=1 Tax=Oopsacas minuta TaxID=111878 RepID=A0AAV7K7R2_9METZ|nr:Homocysteine S-methyltransferase [Oopsacas minuta]
MATAEVETFKPELRLILDGSMGSELHDTYPKVPDFYKLWSTAYLIHKPEYIVDLHKRYIQAGADVITTNNYSTVPRFLNNVGMLDRMEELVKLSGELAVKAVDTMRPTTKRPILIAGCIPPLNYSFQGEKIEKMEEASLLYEKIANALKPSVHFYLCETMSSLDEAIASLTGVTRVSDKPIWISLSLQDNDKCVLHSEEPLKEVLPIILDRFPKLLAVSLNCSNHYTITKGLDTVMEVVKGRKNIKYIAAYANDLNPIPDKEAVNKLWERFDGPSGFPAKPHNLDVTNYRDTIKGWVDKGCNVVGGCCGVGPAFIEEISKHWFPAREVRLVPPKV